MAAGSYFKVNVRFGDIHLLEKYLRHILIVVLAGMNNNLPAGVTVFFDNQPAQYGCFDKLRACTHYRYDFFHYTFSIMSSPLLS